MPKTQFNSQIEEYLLDLLWSLWAELGISGWTQNHKDWWIDPEALLLLTAPYADLDPRLRDEAIEWSIHNARFLSAGRFKNLLRKMPSFEEALQGPSAQRFLGEIKLNTQLNFPSNLKKAKIQLRRSSSTIDLERPGNLSLRLRSLFGVGTRAEILRVFLLGSSEGYSASHLLERGVGYSKRGVQTALEELSMGSFLSQEKIGNSLAFRLKKDVLPKLFLDQRPSIRPNWYPLIEILSLIPKIQISKKPKRKVDVILLRADMNPIIPLVKKAKLSFFPYIGKESDVWNSFQKWSLKLFEDISKGKAPSLA